MAQAYDLTWHDLHVVQTTTLTTEERECIQAAAQEHADQVHLTDATMPVGAQAVPAVEPGWHYQNGHDGRRRRDRMIQCLIARMRRPPIRLLTMIRSGKLFRSLTRIPPYSLTD